MLILTRKEAQSVLIGDDIKVTILKLGGGQVRIGFDAPEGVVILREELNQDDEESGVSKSTR